jgi:hypothetical protein
MSATKKDPELASDITWIETPAPAPAKFATDKESGIPATNVSRVPVGRSVAAHYPEWWCDVTADWTAQINK